MIKSDNWIILDSPWFRPFLSLIFNIYITDSHLIDLLCVKESGYIMPCFFGGQAASPGGGEPRKSQPDRGVVAKFCPTESMSWGMTCFDHFWSFLMIFEHVCLPGWCWTCWTRNDIPMKSAIFVMWNTSLFIIVPYVCSPCLYQFYHFPSISVFSPPFFLHFCSLNHQPPPHWGINMAPGVCVGGASPPMALRNCRTVGGTQRGW